MNFDTDTIHRFKAETPQTHYKESEEVAFLKNSILKGSIDQDNIRIFILDEVYDHILKYARTDLKNELAGVLLGELIERDEYDVLIVNGVLDAKHTVQTDTTLEYTEKTWAAIHREKEVYFSESQIIGWFHTCPDQGLSLSSDDAFIEHNFSDFLWKLACITDPVSNIIDFFERNREGIYKCPGYYIYSKTKHLTEDMYNEVEKNESSTPNTFLREQVRQNKRKMPTHIRMKDPQSFIQNIINIVLLAVVVILAFSQFQLNKKYEEITQDVNSDNALQITLHEQKNRIKALEDKITQLEEQSFIEMPEETDITGEETDTEQQPSVPQNNEQTTAEGAKYVVKSGETLWTICVNHYGDGQKFKLVMEANGFEKESDIKAGQTILLPNVND